MIITAKSKSHETKLSHKDELVKNEPHPSRTDDLVDTESLSAGITRSTTELGVRYETIFDIVCILYCTSAPTAPSFGDT